MPSSIGNEENQDPFEIIGGILLNGLNLVPELAIDFLTVIISDYKYIFIEEMISSHMIMVTMRVHNHPYFLSQSTKGINQVLSYLAEA